MHLAHNAPLAYIIYIIYIYLMLAGRHALITYIQMLHVPFAPCHPLPLILLLNLRRRGGSLETNSIAERLETLFEAKKEPLGTVAARDRASIKQMTARGFKR